MEKLNQWMMLLANIGVLAGIVFLAFEIQVNTAAVRSQVATDYIANFAGNTSNMDDPEIIRIRQQVREEGWDAIQKAHRTQLIYSAVRQYRANESAHFQWVEGNLDIGLWKGNANGLYNWLWAHDWMRQIWPTIRASYSADFQLLVDQIIGDICSQRECPDAPEWAKPNGQGEAAAQAWSARFDDA